MSLLQAIDPGASPGRAGCEAKGCTSTTTTSVRAYLGRIHPTTVRVCAKHRRDLEIVGDLESPMECLYPPCRRLRAAPSRLCAEHSDIVAKAGFRIPKTGVLGAETLLNVRTAIEAAETAGAAPAKTDGSAPDYLGACWEHLRDHVAGGTRIDMAVAEVVGELKQTRKNLARREQDWESAVRIAELRGDEVRAASAALTALGVPMIQADPAEPQYDLVARIKRLAMRPTVQPEPVPADVLQPEAIAARVAVCPAHGPQTTCDEDRCCRTCGRDLVVCADATSADVLVQALRAARDSGTVEFAEAQARATKREAELLDRLGAIEEALVGVGAPDGVRDDPSLPIDDSPPARIRALAWFWRDAIRSGLPGQVRGEGHSELARTLDEIRQGLATAAQERADESAELEVYRGQLAALRDRLCGSISGRLLPTDDDLVKEAETYWQGIGRQVGHTEALEALSVQLLARPALRAAVAHLWIVPGAPTRLLTRGVESIDGEDAQLMSRALLGLQGVHNG